jgi:hypothetical protein
MLKTFGAALLLASGLAITAALACALQIHVTQIRRSPGCRATRQR